MNMWNQVELTKYFRDLVTIADMPSMRLSADKTIISPAVLSKGAISSDVVNQRCHWKALFMPDNVTFFSSNDSKFEFITSHTVCFHIIQNTIFSLVHGGNRRMLLRAPVKVTAHLKPIPYSFSYELLSIGEE